MSALSRVAGALGELRVPRAAVLLISALVLVAPAGFVLADPESCDTGRYRCNPESQVKHRHTDTYSVYNAIGNVDSVLKQRTADSVSQWNTKLTGMTSLSMPSVSGGSGAAIKLNRYDFPDSNSAVTWTAPYHPSSQTEIAFDADRTRDWPGSRKQGMTCRALGNVIGLEDAPPGRDDCMDDPLAHINVRDQSIGYVDDYYGPEVSLSGSFKQKADSLKPNRTYELDATGKGHALAKVEIYVDGAAQPAATSAQTAPCSDGDRCARTASLAKLASEIGSGEHSLRAVATNEFGQTASASLDIFIDHPSTGILPHYSFEDERLWDRASARVNVVNGNLVFSQSDFEVAGTTLDLAISRYYNSQADRASDLGPGWSFDTGSGIELKELANGDVRFFGPSGYAARFKQAGAGYETPTGIDAGLSTRSGGGWNLDLYQSEERYVFDSQGRFDEHVNQKSDQRIDFVYGAPGGKLSKITDTQERDFSFDYWTTTDAITGAYDGRLKQISDPTGRTWRYAYDAQGRLKLAELGASPTAVPEITTGYVYEPGGSGRLSAVSDPRGIQTTIGYDNKGRVDALTRPASTTTGEFDAGDPGYTRSFVYDAPDPVPSQCFKNPGDPTEEERDYELTTVTAPRGNETTGTPGDYETTYCHDAENRVGQVVDARDNQQSVEWSTRSNVKSYSSGSGATTAREYTDPSAGSDPARLSRVSEPGGAATNLSYAGASATTFNPSAVTDPQQNKLKYGYESADNTGNLETIKDANENPLVTLAYHEEGDGEPELKGLLKSSTLHNEDSGPRGSGGDQKTTYEYDAEGNLTAEVPPDTSLQERTIYEYDSLSRVKAVTDGNGVRRTISYDLQDRPKVIHYPPDDQNKQQEFDTCLTYDPNGNLIRRLDNCESNGRVDGYTYNLRNLRILDDLGATSGNRQMGYLYDPDANLEMLRFISPNEGDIRFEHNEINLLSKVIDGAGSDFPRETDYTYSKDYLPERIDFPNGVVQKLTYREVDDPGDQDNDGSESEQTNQVRSITAWSNGTPESADPDLVDLSYDYDRPPYEPDSTAPSSEQTALRTRVRDQHATSDSKTEYTYDERNRITAVDEDGQAAYEYLYDRASNIKELTDHGQTRSFEHNVANEVRCSYSGAQQPDCPAGADDYDYDLNGNLSAADSGPTYAYDKRNRTVGLTPPGQAEVPFDYADYSQSERVRRGDTEFTDTLLGTQIEDSPAGRRIYLRTDQGQPLAVRPALGTPAQDLYLLQDSLGSTVVVTDGSGQEAARYSYSPYGETTAGGSQAPLNPFRYAGQYLDAATGHYKMGLRYYDPATSRWTQKDPLNLFQDPRQANRYQYAGADPVNRVDPSGLNIFEDAFDWTKQAVDDATGWVEQAFYDYGECIREIIEYDGCIEFPQPEPPEPPSFLPPPPDFPVPGIDPRRR